MKGDLIMALERLKEYLDNLGPGVHDVVYRDKNGNRLHPADLKGMDFDNLLVLRAELDSRKSSWTIMNLILDVKKAAR